MRPPCSRLWGRSAVAAAKLSGRYQLGEAPGGIERQATAADCVIWRIFPRTALPHRHDRCWSAVVRAGETAIARPPSMGFRNEEVITAIVTGLVMLGCIVAVIFAT